MVISHLYHKSKELFNRARSEQVWNKVACGGLGDFLQQVKAARKEAIIDLLTHSKESGAKFFKDLNIAVNKCYLFENFQELQDIKLPPSITHLERDYYDKTVCVTALELSTEREIFDLALHPFGSRFSLHCDRFLHGNKGKNIPLSLLEHIVTMFLDHKIIILGTREELDTIQALAKYKNVTMKETSIWDAIYFTCTAKGFIGADSCLKTARGIYLKKPVNSLVFVEKKADPFRDMHFIHPYQDRLSFFYYTDLQQKEQLPLDAIERCMK